MNISPKDGPNVNNPANAQAVQPQSARERAIAKLMESPAPKENQSQREPVQNASQVSAEELPITRYKESTQPATSVEESSSSVSEATKPKEDPMRAQYEQLARRERALRAKVQAQESAIKAREAAFAEREAAIKAKEAEYTSNYIPKSKFKADPLSVLTEEGISYDEITKAILNPQQQDPRILAEIEKLKAEVQASRDAQTKAQEEYSAQKKQEYSQAVAQIKNETQRLVQNSPDYEMIRETKSVSDVVDLIEKTFAEDGILLSVEEAAKEVEEYLVSESLRLSKINKIRAQLQELQKPTQQQAPVNKQPQSGMKTLTNSANASKPMSSRERAIAAFKGELKE